LVGYLDSWLPARAIVENAISNNLLFEGRVVRFDQFCPWQEHLFDIEREKGISGQILYALFPDTTGQWRIQAVGTEGTSFQNRKPLPQEWRGLRDEELSKKSGIEGCVFVHAGGFIGGNKTLEGVMQMAKDAVECGDEPDKKRQRTE
jgi:uncharacterized UPF0160 family protein